MFNRGSLYGFGVPLLVYTNHINNEKYVHHGFLAPRAYLCSTSLNYVFNGGGQNGISERVKMKK